MFAIFSRLGLDGQTRKVRKKKKEVPDLGGVAAPFTAAHNLTDMALFINGVLGSYRNKLGNIVTYVRAGENVARTKAANISNPRTAAQMSQRVKLANVVAMFRANSTWMARKAFSNKPARWSVYNAFTHANLTASRVALTKQQAAAGWGIVAPYQMTSGQLPSVEVSNTVANVWETNLGVGSGFTIGPTTTVGMLSAALIENNNVLVPGFQLSQIINYQQQGADSYYIIARWFEIILDTTDDTLLSDRLDITHLGVNNNNLTFTKGQNDPVIGFCFVLSWTHSGQTYVSTQRMTLTDSTLYDTFTTEQAAEAAALSYGGGDEEPFLVSEYGSTGVNPNVDIPMSILSVNSKVAGQYLGTGSAASNRLTVILSQATTDVTEVYLKIGSTYYRSTATQSAPTFTVSDNVITINTQPIGSANEMAIVEVGATIGGVEFTINFSQTDPGEVTE